MEFYTNVSKFKGDYIYVRGFDETGRFQRKVKYEPTLYQPSQQNTGYYNIYGQNVKPKLYDSISKCHEELKLYDGVRGKEFYGLTRWPYIYIYDTYKNLNPDTSKINIVLIDIEVASDDGFPEPLHADKEVTAISLRRRDLKIILGCGDFVTDEKNTYYIKCKNEYQLLCKFLEIWNELDADVVTGWNTEFFDIPYLVHRIRRIVDEDAVNKLSPWGIITKNTVRRNSKEEITYNIGGVSCLDYLAVYRKFQLDPRESYRLDYIAEVELGVKKIDYSEYGNLFALYKENFQKFIEYNIRDTDLIFMLEEKLGFLEQIFAISYDAKVNYIDALASVLIWDVIIHNYLLDKNVVINPRSISEMNRSIEGGFVKEPITGMHKWVMSFDLNSLYPHLIQQYNISPDTRASSNAELYNLTRNISVDHLLDKKIDTEVLKKYDYTMTPNGQFYRRDVRGFLPALMKEMYDDRTKYKQKMIEAKQEYEKTPTKELEIDISRYHNLQLAKKIQLNSAYGALANQYFRWFDLENAEAITKAGQLSIRWIERKLNEYLNKLLKTNDKDYVLAVDTDSVYIVFDELVNQVLPNGQTNEIVEFLDRVAKTKIESYIDKCYEELADYMNAVSQKMFMKRENIADKAIWTAKKRYIMNVHDSEGVRYNEPKLKMMGIEAIRSSTPGVCRDYIKKTLELIMNESETVVQKYIADIRKEFNTLKFEQIAFPRSVNFLTWKETSDGQRYPDTYADKKNIYKKGTPIQVKGALIYNHYLDKYNLTKKYESINDGEKIKFSYLKKPNPLHDMVISCPDTLPTEFKLEEYIDYEMQFVKGYLDPVNVILNTIGWNHEKKATLEDFFND